MSIEAIDGHIGTVDELMVDPAGGQITHLVLQKGHLWGEAHVTLPITEIDRVEGYTIFLKLNKVDIEVMPVVQIRRHYSKKKLMSWILYCSLLLLMPLTKPSKPKHY